MSNALVKINLHLVFHVKSGGVTMRGDDLTRVFGYIGGLIRNMGEIPIAVGGTSDHIHILASLPKTMTVADYARAIKANTSRWIKTLHSGYAQFAWQEGYGAFSVSPSLLDTTANYIHTQAEHHRRRTAAEEFQLLAERYGLSATPDGVRHTD